ncbi:MAG TPA: signal peptidase I [Candidatus Saccharimonadales bacterium]|nr:signal peptidase I [Candidatus Saccharimonadales bacterium]
MLRQIYSHRETKKRIHSRLIFFAATVFNVLLMPIWVGAYILAFVIFVNLYGGLFGYSPIMENIFGTGSMSPTFPKGTGASDKENFGQVVVTPEFNRYPTGFRVFGTQFFNHTLERGDIVIFENKKTDEISRKQYGSPSGFVKRVIGLSGDTLELRGGIVYLNGKPLKEPYTAGPQTTFGEEFLSECKRITVPTGKVFVMGDNRKGSGDSREFGFVDVSDIQNVLTLAAQKGIWDKYWRDTSKDFDSASKIKLDKQEFLKLLNKKRKEAGVPELKYEDKLEQTAQKRGEMIIKYDDFSFEGKKSGYTMLQAMNEVGFSDPEYGESTTQGYFTADEFIDNQFSFPDTQKFLLNKDYDEVGISEVEGQINGCPTQIIVQHFAGYVPPNYSQSDVQSWQTALANLQGIQPGWAALKDNADFYGQHKADVDRINELVAQRIANVSTVLTKMQANQWLNASENQMVKNDASLANEINALADKLNQSQ